MNIHIYRLFFKHINLMTNTTMISAELHPQEEDRLVELLKFEVLDSDDEICFDELTEIASTICGTPISLISLVDSQRQWFKSRVGLDARETPKSLAFCAHAILQQDIFEVPNALADERFADNPLVTESPDIRFYAGQPLITSNGLPIGTLCVIDTQPRSLSDEQKRALEILAKQVINQLELRLHARKMQRMNKQREQFYGVLAHDLKSPFNGVLGLSRLLVDSSDNLEVDKVKLYSKEILNSSLRIYQILDEILQWTEHSALTGKPILSSLAIKECVDNSTELLSESIKAKDININIQVSPSIEAIGNKALFKTTVRNLISNAIKYSPKGGSIFIKASNKEQNMHFTIQDEGEGIPDSLRHQLFKNTVSSHEGTLGEAGHGLGLHLTHELILMQNGRIWIDENYKNGTLIHCVLPII
ncbi:MAG: K+-sensing histidine kinase KdpD [Oleiphilaceae bacterium]|jgi:K+-sensing histidine kinase KdpD